MIFMADQLKGTDTTINGILAIILGGVGLFSQILSGVRGQAMNAAATTASLGAITSGIGLLRAADQKQAAQQSVSPVVDQPPDQLPKP